MLSDADKGKSNTQGKNSSTHSVAVFLARERAKQHAATHAHKPKRTRQGPWLLQQPRFQSRCARSKHPLPN
jgi:hypothetical protein